MQLDGNPIRQSAFNIVSRFPGAFLRCDRGSALYITNAPALGYGALSEQLFAGQGFSVYATGKLLYVIPDAVWRELFCEWAHSRGASGFIHVPEAFSERGIADDEALL